MWISGSLAILGLAATFSSLGADLSSASEAEDFLGDWFVYWAITLVASMAFFRGALTYLSQDLAGLARSQEATGEPEWIPRSAQAARRATKFLWVGIVSAIVGVAGILIGIEVITKQAYGDNVFPLLLIFLLILLLAVRIVVLARRVLRAAGGPSAPGAAGAG